MEKLAEGDEGVEEAGPPGGGDGHAAMGEGDAVGFVRDGFEAGRACDTAGGGEQGRLGREKPSGEVGGGSKGVARRRRSVSERQRQGRVATTGDRDIPGEGQHGYRR